MVVDFGSLGRTWRRVALRHADALVGGKGEQHDETINGVLSDGLAGIGTIGLRGAA